MLKLAHPFTVLGALVTLTVASAATVGVSTLDTSDVVTIVEVDEPVEASPIETLDLFAPVEVTTTTAPPVTTTTLSEAEEWALVEEFATAVIEYAVAITPTTTTTIYVPPPVTAPPTPTAPPTTTTPPPTTTADPNAPVTTTTTPTTTTVNAAEECYAGYGYSVSADIARIICDAAAEFNQNGTLFSARLMFAIAKCESGFNPGAKNPNSSASGLFQHLATYWPPRAAAVGQPGASVFDATANARATAHMLATQGTTPWNASRHCWG